MDVVYYGPAEYSFDSIVKSLAEGNDPDGIPRAITKSSLVEVGSDKESFMLRKEMQTSLKEKAQTCVYAPEFEGLYDSKTTPVPVPAMHNQTSCPEKCGFCAINYTSPYTRIKADDFAYQVAKVSSQLGTSMISVTDLTMYPKVYEQISEALKGKNIKITWDNYMQLDKKLYSLEYLKSMAADGLRLVQYGLESPVRATLDIMNKAVTGYDQARILKNGFEAGIWNMVFYIVGYPGASLMDDLAIIPFLEKNGQHIFAIKPNRFKLALGSPIEAEYEEYRFGIKEPKDRPLLEIQPTGDLATNMDFEYRTGQSKKVIDALLRTIERWVKERHSINIGYVLERFGAHHYSGEELEILKSFSQENAPLNEVVRTYIYHQRHFFPFEFPYVTALKKFAHDVRQYGGDMGRFRKSLSEKADRISHYGTLIPAENDYKTLWNAIVGKDLLNAHKKYESGKRQLDFVRNYKMLK